ncbi:MAG TPA: sulfatase-like hydrolase/transferase [Candidatus Paceibacterota bacterium]|nr:sulfatase-like hydrolase/transferase [Verrucomicrobiota bacterium]HRZ47464.1 sulfatase-like hydrolase/transferase [Candidatus Paceibacterota bacterium]
MKTTIQICIGLLLAGLAASAAEAPLATPSGLAWQSGKDMLELRQNGQTLWCYRFGPDQSKPCFHPVALPGGPALTSYRPNDHRWHRALWFSWKFINGINYWEEDAATGQSAGRTELSNTQIETWPDFSARITQALRYRPSQGDPVLTEHRVLHIQPPDASGEYSMDWTMTFTAVTNVLLDRTPLPDEPNGKPYGGYAGLSVRFANELDSAQAATTAGPVAFTAGRYRGKAAAMDYSGTLNGREVGIAILDHPSNLNAPSPWYAIHSDPMRFFSPAVISPGPFTLRAGQSMSLRYRVAVHPGRWNVARLESETARFAGLASPAKSDRPESSAASPRPNILLIYADDLGYGDVGCYGATAVRTPHVDRLAREGLRFTSAYSAAATCTPSRYALLTGEYAFRRKGTGVLPGDAALIIEPGRSTLPALLAKAGYATAAVGKWHLGLGSAREPIDWNRDVQPGPLDIGFGYSFIMAATGDRVPCVYLENRRVVGLDPADSIQVSYAKPFPDEPTGITHRNQLKLDWSHGHNQAVVNGIGRIGFMKGGRSARWIDEDMADLFTQKAVAFLECPSTRPFFLYFATHDVHVPRVPHPRFAGQTTMGARGDAIVQFDACVGALLDTLDRRGLAADTLVILTSDNGPVLDDGYQDQANEKRGDHRPSGPFRAGKYSMFEGGTRIPFLIRWPGRIQPGTSDALLSQVDLVASLAALTGQSPDPQTSPDSRNLLPALLGDSPAGRDHVLEHAGNVALRQGPWKFIPPGQTRDGLGPWNTAKIAAPGALYNLADDPGETNNLASREPDRVRTMRQTLEQHRQDSRP